MHNTNGSQIIVNKKDLAIVTAQLVREGVIFSASPSIKDSEQYIIEFTGGY